MKVYTRTGDKGTTSLVGGKRIAKDDIRLEAYGTVDELNSWLGLIDSSTSIPQEVHDTLSDVMNRLFDIGSILATEPESTWQPQPLPQSATTEIESAIDKIEAMLPKHNKFILPGGHADSARANIARTVARRAERRIITLASSTPIDSEIIRYINRLSDYLFVLSRIINNASGTPERFWDGGKASASKQL